jgi:hypothetical protein
VEVFLLLAAYVFLYAYLPLKSCVILKPIVQKSQHCLDNIETALARPNDPAESSKMGGMLLRMICCEQSGGENTEKQLSISEVHALRLVFHASRLVFHASRLVFNASRLVLRLVFNKGLPIEKQTKWVAYTWRGKKTMCCH